MPPKKRTQTEQPLYRWSGSSMAQRRDRTKAVLRREIEHLPHFDHHAWYDRNPHIALSDREYDAGGPFIHPIGVSSERDSGRPTILNHTNLGNKLLPNARYMRQGKLAAWSPMMEPTQNDQHVRKRLAMCLEDIFPPAAADVGAEPPRNIVKAIESRKRARVEAKRHADFVLPHLRSPSPPLSSEELAPMLALPQTYLDIMISPSMRHTLGDDTVEQGLQRTASELLECEKPLLQSLGRLRDLLRFRDLDHSEIEAVPLPITSAGADLGTELIPELPTMHETDNLWRVQQDLIPLCNPPPTLTYEATDPRVLTEPSVRVRPTMIQRLFIEPDGITLKAWEGDPSTVPMSKKREVAVLGMAAMQNAADGNRDAAAPKKPLQQYNINGPKQVVAVKDALERVAELLADCIEYKERLEEARNRVANVARARKRVWAVIQERASAELDRLEDKDLPPSRLL